MAIRDVIKNVDALNRKLSQAGDGLRGLAGPGGGPAAAGSAAVDRDLLLKIAADAERAREIAESGGGARDDELMRI